MKRLTAEPGTVFNNFTFIRDLGSREVGVYNGIRKLRGFWFCRCVCGREGEYPASVITLGRIKSCGCVRKRPAPKLAPGQAMVNHLHNAYRQNAKKRGLAFELTRSEFMDLTSADCYYCGAAPCKTIQVFYSRNSKQNPGAPRSTSPYLANGVDRIVNSLGYTKGNCVPCCELCNQMKKALDVDAFFRHIHMIARKHPTPKG